MRNLKSILLVFLMQAAALGASAQITSVHGTVSDDLEPLIGATVCEIDANGRFVIPPFLREELSSDMLDKVVFAGSNDYIEIWTAEGWKNAEEKAFHDEAMTSNFAMLMNAQWSRDD